MSEAKNIGRLVALAGMMRDMELAQVSAAAKARQDSLDRLADLAQPRTTDAVDPLAAARAQVLYEVWADQRRAEIRLLLERQTRQWQQAQAKARVALGRADVLDQLAQAARDKARKAPV